MTTHVYAGMCVRVMREARSFKSGGELHVGSEQIELGSLSFEESDALVVICLALELHDGHFFDGDARHGVFGVHHKLHGRAAQAHVNMPKQRAAMKAERAAASTTWEADMQHDVAQPPDR